MELYESERDELRDLLAGGRQPARRLKRAQILLAADQGAADAEIAGRVVCGLSTVTRTKHRFVEGNLELALSEALRSRVARKLTDREEALLIATACSKPPPGRARWTLELLCGAMVRLTEHHTLSRETVSRCLGENQLNPFRWKSDMTLETLVTRIGDELARSSGPIEIGAFLDPYFPGDIDSGLLLVRAFDARLILGQLHTNFVSFKGRISGITDDTHPVWH